MRELSERVVLALEQRRGALDGRPWAQAFQRDGATARLVDGPEDLPHAAFGDQRFDPIATRDARRAFAVQSFAVRVARACRTSMPRCFAHR